MESEFYAKNPNLIGLDLIPKVIEKRKDFLLPLSLSNVVYGFHPYWISDVTSSNYYYSLLTHFVYFSAEVDTSLSTTGNFSHTRNWATTQSVNYPKNYGKKVHLSVTMFDNHNRILNNNTNRQNLINNIIFQLNLRNADGCNLDFEGISSTLADSFRTFVYQLGTQLKANNKEFTVCIPAVDWSNVYNATFFSYVNSVVDYYFLMAYDYYWRGSTTAGPVAPLSSGTSFWHVTRSIRTYLSRGCGAHRLIAGFPYYGYDWPVSSSNRMATTTGNGTARYYSFIKSFIDTIAAGDKFTSDPTYNVPWYRYISSGWRQVWYDDSLSLAKKYDSVKTLGIAGTGMWALGYDGSNTELWGALNNAFASNSNLSNIILENFEQSVGRFYRQPTFSGSTTGISSSSSSNRNVGFSLNGAGSLEIKLFDNTSSTNDWTVRLLSGGGFPDSNQVLNSTGYIGFYLKTSTAPANAKVAITIDDGAGGTELSPKFDVINDGQWNLYQWNLNSTGWSNFAGGNGVINGLTVTLDAIMFYAPNNSPQWNIYIDDVSYNQNNPLPVELVNFNALLSGRKVHLSWMTINEINSFGFEVEKSIDLSFWQTLGFVPAKGNSTLPINYSYTDEKFEFDKSYYRLKVIDTDGSFKYSNIIDVKDSLLPDYSLYQNYPNPFNSSTIFTWYMSKDGLVELILFDPLGQEIKKLLLEERTAGLHKLELELDNLTSGVYYYQLRINDFVETKKMILVK
jgi:spore germination protein YaaH